MSNVFRYPSNKQLTGRPIHIGTFQEPTRDTNAENELTYEDQIKQKKVSAEEIVEQAKQQAEQLIDQAKQEAERLYVEAKTSIQHAHQEAKQTGYEEGKKEGLGQAKEQYQSLIDQANDVVRQTKASYLKKLSDAEEDLVTLSVEIAEKIIHETFELNEDRFIQLVKQTVNEVSDQPEVHVYVHPKTYQLVINQQEELERILSGKGQLSVFSNEELSAYACLIESPFGKIDASVDKQLSKVKEKLLQLVKESQQRGS
ncbi:flagellar assembly protein FliH [Allobacillus sp. GCM10007491]|uniref:Flagellar assembly protein FliH n=1 Tax=Allobacillus saliphilus TaxID=2912308 RepID=A0A941CS35_9BACI|nr:flagellar assembly protein FliH [Allobacillus saliphilus]